MKRMNKLLSLIVILISFCFITDVKAVNPYSDSSVGTYEQELAKFPSSFKSKVEALHKIYPNAVFVVQDKFLDWGAKKEVAVDFERMVASENTTNGRSLVYYTFNDGYKSTEGWAYNYYTNKFTAFSGGSWNAASKQTIRYYLDARNFLDERHVFMFESQYYKDYQTVSGVEKILAGTFMANKKCAGSDKTYAQVIVESGQKNDISPYMLASRLRQEQGTKGTSSLISGTYSGYKNLYNYFNVSASGTTEKDVIVNGLKKAKTEGWTTPYLSIIGGAKFIYDEYIGVNDKYGVKGQMTNYLQKFDPYGYNLGGHQYMQNISAPYTEAETTYNSYASFQGFKNYKYIFYIPIYSNMPATAASLPAKGNPNNYLKNITVNGAKIGTDANYKNGVESYSINVSPTSTEVNIGYTKVASTSTVSGAGIVKLTQTKQTINLVVTAANGAKKTYKVIINRDPNANLSVSEIISGSGIKSDGTNISGIDIGTSQTTFINKIVSVGKNCKVTISKNSNNKTNNLATGDKVTIISGNETKTYNVVIYGDVNGDGSIKATDYVKIKNHIMGTNKLSGSYQEAADVNKDNSVKATDYVVVKNSIMGNYKISQ